MKVKNRATDEGNCDATPDAPPDATSPPIDKPRSRQQHPPDALIHFDHMPDSAYVRLRVVKELFGISSATVWRWSKMGKITATRLSENTTGWNVGGLRRALKAAA